MAEVILDTLVDVSRNWFIAFSGGKDSTTLLSLVYNYAPWSKGVNAVVIYNDVLLDPPPLYTWVYNVLNHVSRKLNTYVIIPKVDYIEMLLGKRYSPPGYRFTWCTTELKRKPLSRFARQLGYGEKVWIKLTAVRLDESPNRKRLIEERKCGTIHLQKSRRGHIDGAPIAGWTLRDILSYLENNTPPWGGLPYTYLLENVYCGNPHLRTGCWICTLVSKDKMLQAYAVKHDPRYLKIIELKQSLSKIGFDQSLREAKSKKLNQEGVEKSRRILVEMFKTMPELLRPYITHRREHVIEYYLPDVANLLKQVEPYEIGRVNRVEA